MIEGSPELHLPQKLSVMKKPKWGSLKLKSPFRSIESKEAVLHRCLTRLSLSKISSVEPHFYKTIFGVFEGGKFGVQIGSENVGITKVELIF